MEIIYTDIIGGDVGILKNATIDVDIGKDNNFEIKMPLSDFTLKKRQRWYIPKTEYGGIIRGIKTDTKENTAYYYGYTWRGMLAKKIIEPESGKDYRTVSGTNLEIISKFLTEFGFDDIFMAGGGDVITIPSYTFDRYVNAADGLDAMLKTVNHKLVLQFEPKTGKVWISSSPINDFADEIEFSTDGNVYVTIEDNDTAPTQLVCLGKGDLKAREVIHLYRDDKNNISEAKYYTGIDDRAEVYDAANTQDLRSDGTKHFTELLKTKAIDVDVSGYDINLHDIVSARDYISGQYISKEITQKIASISAADDNITISYKTGDKSLF